MKLKFSFSIGYENRFCNQTKHIMLGEDYDLMSFDVFSLFTLIPVDLAIQVATVWLSNDDTLQDRTSIPVDDMADHLHFCMFVNNKLY